MSGAMLEVRFTGDNPQHREAFENPAQDYQRQVEQEQRSSAHQSPSESPSPPPVSSASGTSPRTTPATSPREPRLTEPTPRPAAPAADGDSREDRLLMSIDKLVETLDEHFMAERTARANPQARKKDDGQPASAKGKGQSATDSLAEDVAPVTSLIRRMIPPELLEIGKWLQKFVDKHLPGVRDAGRSIASSVSQSPVGKAVSRVIPSVGKRSAGKAAANAAAQAATGAATTAAARTAAAGAASTAATAAGSAAEAGAATGAAGGAAGAVAATGPVGVAAAGAAVALASAAIAAKLLDTGLHSAARSLEEYSPHLASVRAQQDVRFEMQRLDRADRLGPQLAQFEAARGKVSEAGNELLTKILELILKASPQIEMMLDTATAGVRGIDLVVAALNVVASRINDFTSGDQADNAPADAALDKSQRAFIQAMRDISQNAMDPHMGMDPQLAAVLQMPFPGNNPPRQFPPNMGNFP